MPTSIPFDKRQKIIAQALREISFARTYKQGKIRNWQKNEEMYYGKKQKSEDSRANVDLGLMQAHVHTILSKIDNPLQFKFSKRKPSQKQRVENLNGLRVVDQQNDFWDIKDLVGKKQVTIYGRAIYSYFADSVNGNYKPHLENVDVYDFLIDPAAGGIDIEKARYLGDYGLVYDKAALKAGIKSGQFLKTETTNLINGVGNATEQPQEETNKRARTADQNTWQTSKEIADTSKWKFWRWGTTFSEDGQRYYLTLTTTGGTAIEVCPIEDKFESGLWWYWTYAAFPDLTEFWTPGYCDYVRELFLAQMASVNQGLDNSEAINKPQKIVQVGSIENLAELKYRKDGIIKVKKTFNADQAIQFIRPPQIDTPIKMFELLDGIASRSSGVTPAAQGQDDTNGSATIYNGNEANTADRFGLLNKSYSFGYHRFAILWQHGVDENLVKKTAVEILGTRGIIVQDVSRRDIFKKGETFGVLVEASNAEDTMSLADKKAKLDFLSAQQQLPMPIQNQKKAYELAAGIVGFDQATITQLTDTSNFADEDVMSQAEEDLENLLEGKPVRPYQAANNNYKQYFVTYGQEHRWDMSDKDFRTLAGYILQINPIVMKNMVTTGNAALARTMTAPQPPMPNANNGPGGGARFAAPVQNGAGVDTLQTPVTA